MRNLAWREGKDLKENMLSVLKYIKGRHKKNSQKLELGPEILVIKRNISIQQWKDLSTDVMGSPLLEVFKK